MNSVDSSRLASLNYQLNMSYQEQNTQALVRSGNKTYLVQQQTIRFQFELTVSDHTSKQLAQQNEWQQLAEKLMQDKPQMPATPDEAQALISDEGFYGVPKTAERMAQFVIQGAGEDEGLLQAGRAGILKGFEEAQKLWGGELPEIAQRSLEEALKQIDEHMASLGFSILNAQG
jgi:hypothetical protein